MIHTIKATPGVRTIIADEQPLVLHAIESLIVGIPGIEVVARVTESSQLFTDIGSSPCDLLVIDPGTLGKAGLQADGRKMIRRFRSHHPSVAVIVMTAEDSADTLQNLVDLGVAGVVSKRDGIEVIRDAIESALARRCYVGPSIRTQIANAAASRNDFAAVLQKLSPREQEVLAHYASGLGVTEIAEKLGRSIKTISAQKCTAMKKLALTRDADLFRWWAETGRQLADQQPELEQDASRMLNATDIGRPVYRRDYFGSAAPLDAQPRR